MTGARKVEHVRNLGKLSPEEQRAKADERAEAARGKAEARPREAVERSAGPTDYHGVIIPKAPDRLTTSSPLLYSRADPHRERCRRITAGT